MYKIGVLARPGRDLIIARTEIHKNHLFEVKAYTNAFRAAQGLKTQEYSALVMVADKFGSTQAEIVHQIKKRFPELPLVVVTDGPDFDLKQQVIKYQKAIVLDAKTEMRDVPGVLAKMLKNLPVVVRDKQRYRTSQQASLRDSQTTIYPSWLFNLGPTGAQLRVFGKNLKKGEQVRLNVFLPSLNKEHQVMGEVVWINADRVDEGKTSQMVGVRFLR